MQISELCKAVRLKLGMKQREFAAAVGVKDPSAVRNWEHARNEPRDEYLLAMARLAPEFAKEIERTVSNRSYHKGPLRAHWMAAIDIILRNAPRAMLDKVNEFLEERANRYETLEDLGGAVFPEDLKPISPAPARGKK